MSKRGQEINYRFISVIAVKHKPNFLGKNALCLVIPFHSQWRCYKALFNQTNIREVDEEM